jgi:hypothetical protein
VLKGTVRGTVEISDTSGKEVGARVWIIAMRLGAKSCAHYFGNQSSEWRYEGVVQKITTNAFGVKVAKVLYEEGDEATESALHHVYPLDEDDLPYDGDVKSEEGRGCLIGE